MPISKYRQQKKLSVAKGASLKVDADLIERFIGHVKNEPDLSAIITSDTTWSYGELYQEVLFWKTQIEKMQQDTTVILCLHRTPKLIAILLALLWLETPYIPLEISTPLERIKDIIEDSRATILLHDLSNHAMFTALPCDVYALSMFEATSNPTQKKQLKQKRKSKVSAYTIYTSGSTGKPKGVKVSRLALNNFLASMGQYFLQEKEQVVLAITTIAFDIAALELYLPLWQRQTIYFTSDNEYKDPLSIKTLLETYPITLMQATPAFWNMLLYSGWEGKKNLVALVGGEPLTQDTAFELLSKVQALWNMYGPTEATIWCSLKQIEINRSITIGLPIHNMEMYVLDSKMRPLPRGQKGELYIGGIGLAEGYINREQLTQEKFIPYNKASTKKVYRTGDVACMDALGEFIVFGRMDNQVKLHGYRIELEDIEAHISAYESVQTSAVAVFNEQLIAYLVLKKGHQFTEAALIDKLSRELPEFMLPTRFIYLKELPLSVSGKVNRRALPTPLQFAHQTELNITPLESSLLSIWKEVFKCDTLSIEDNFFELGGHSLLAARVIAKIHQEFNKKLIISDIYHAPSVKTLAEVIENLPEAVKPHETHSEVSYTSCIPLTNFQLILWISNLFDTQVRKLNVAGRRRIKGQIDNNVLAKALQTIIEKHDVFSYQIGRVFPVQRKNKSRIKQIAWDEVSLTGLDKKNKEECLNNSMKKLYFHVWRRRQPLVLLKLFRLRDGEMELQVAMSHLIADQQSLEVFFKDLSHAYLLYMQEKATKIKLAPKSFESYVRHEAGHNQLSLSKDEQFWRNYLKDSALFNFSKQHIVKNTENHRYSTFFKLEESTLEKWHAYCIKHAVTLNDMLCAGVAATLSADDGTLANNSKQLVINRVQSTREDPYFDEVIGCFLLTHVIKVNLSGEPSLLAMAKQIQKAVIETSLHQNAQTLMKLAAIGSLHCQKNTRLKRQLISCITSLSERIKTPSLLLRPEVLSALCRLASQRHTEDGFLININIWDNFFLHHSSQQNTLFGNPCERIPASQMIDIFTIDRVLDVCLMREDAHNTPYLVVSANLTRQYRKKLGQRLMQTLNT